MDRFNEYWDLLSDKNMSIGKELITFYKILNESDDYSSLSEPCKSFLKSNLLKNPYPACQILRMLTSSKFAFKNKSVEDLCKLTVSEIVDNIGAENCTQLYNIICNLQTTNESVKDIFPVITSKINDRILDRTTIYYALLARKNLNLLNMYLKYEESLQKNELNFKNLLMNAIEYKQHWFLNICERPEHFEDETLAELLKMMHLIFLLNLENINISNIAIDGINPKHLNDNLALYFEEIKRNVNAFQLISDCKTPFNEFPKQKSILNLLQVENVQVSLINYDSVRQIMLENGEEVGLLDQFMIIKLYSDIICLDPFAENYEEDVEKNFGKIKLILRRLENFEMYVEVLESIFSLLFLRHEHFFSNQSLGNEEKSSNSEPRKVIKNGEKVQGFICNLFILEKILNSLKKSTLQRKHTFSETAGDPIKDRFNKILEYINDALYRLSLFSSLSQQAPKRVCFQSVDVCKIVFPHANSITSKTSSDDLEDDLDFRSEDSKTSAKYFTYPKRKARKKKNRLKTSSETTTTTTTGSETIFKEFLKPELHADGTEIEDTHVGKYKNVIVKMLGSPETLAALCMIRDDYEAVQRIIKNYKLEKSSLATDLVFLDNFIQLKSKLLEIIKKFEQNIVKCDAESSTLGEIKNLTAIGFETSKILNVIETFVINNKISQDVCVEKVLEKYSRNYQFLKIFSSDCIHIINVIDLMLSLPNNYDLNLNLYNMVTRFLEKTGNVEFKSIGYLGFLKNVIDSLYQYKTVLGRSDLTIEKLLNVEFYPMNMSALNLKLEKLRLFNRFVVWEGLENFDLLNDIKADVNYFQRIFKLVENIKKMLECCDDDRYKKLTVDEILKLDLDKIIGEMIFEKNIAPEIVERYTSNINTNLIHVVASNSCPFIGPERNFEEKEEYFEIKTENLLDFIVKRNFLIGFLLKEIHKIPSRIEYDHNLLQNMVEIEEIRETSVLYDHNIVLAALNYDTFNLQMIDGKGNDVKVLNNIPEIFYRNNKPIIDALKDQLIINDLNENNVDMISDINKKAEKLLKLIPTIKCPLKVVDLIKNILLSQNLEDLNYFYKENLKNWLHKITVYQKMSVVLNIEDWNKVIEIDNEKILKNLLELQVYDLCYDWIKMNKIDLQNIKFDCFTIAILGEKNFNGTLLKIIEQMPIERTVQFYNIVLPGLKIMETIRYIINYLSKQHDGDHEKYQKYEISLKIFEILPEDQVKKLWMLASRPLLIIEQYLMNSKFDVISIIMKEIRPLLLNDDCDVCIEIRECMLELRASSPEKTINIDSSHAKSFITTECIDCLLRIYASKALDFRIITESHCSTDLLYQSTDLSSLDSLCDAFTMPKEAPPKSKWMRDDEVTHCMGCKRSVFTMLTRRHHCRRCGRVVCHSCSSGRMKIKELYSNILVRVCDDCVKQTENQLKIQELQEEDKERDHSIDENEEWRLSGNSRHDNIVREEFGYEYAPSVSLCLSICNFHSPNEECANFLLFHCGKLESLIRPIQPGYPNPEIDYVLVARMLHCLALAAKVRNGPPECDIMKDHAEIILSIVQNGCEHLLPQEPLNSVSLRKLRDSLVKAEKWSLALELSLKCGFSASGVMAAWGIACLRAGCYETAREKFSHCMSKISTDDENSMLLSYIESESLLNLDNIKEIKMIKRPNKSPPLLSEIINILDATSQPQRPEVLARANMIISSNSSLSSSRTKRKENIPLNEPALNILNTLSNLTQITNGVYNDYIPEKKEFQKNENRMSVSMSMSSSSNEYLKKAETIMTTRYFEECMFYLTSYGNHMDVIKFLIKHSQIVPALKYFLLQKVEPDIFISTILVPYMKSGNLETIINYLFEFDDTLLVWKDYIIQMCRFLEINNMLNSLYDLQTLLKDPVRASMTCVRFYSLNCRTFSDLHVNCFHLYNAQKHLQTELELCNWEEITVDAQKSESQKSLLMKMDLKTLNSHINTILRQLEVAKFLANCERNGRETLSLMPKLLLELNKIPTLFGSLQDKMQLAVLTLICGQNIEEGFGLSFRIIQDFSLNTSKVYGMTAKHLAGCNRFQDVEKLLECVASNSGFESKLFCDEIVSLTVETAISTYGTSAQLKTSLDNLIKKISDIGLKINCHIQCGQLKAAYLLAIQNNRLNDIKKILRHAEAGNQVHIKRLCEKKLGIVKKN